MSSTDDFQAGNVEKGRVFRERCKEILEAAGFTFNRESERFEFGVHVDLIYDNQQDNSFFIQVSGTIEDEPTSTKPGLERADSVRKIICDAYLLQRATGWPTLVLTSHTPAPGTVPARLLNFAGRHVIFDVLSVNSESDMERLAEYARLSDEELHRLSDDIDRPILE